MLIFFRLWLLISLVGLAGTGRAQSRAGANDGFQRRDGVMVLIRNGQKRPMPHDVHLPNGRTVTRDGFVVEPDGRRTELSEGQGCTLAGIPTAVVTTGSGQLALTTTGSRRAAASTPVYQASLLEQVFGRRGKGHRGWGYYKKRGKHKHGKD